MWLAVFRQIRERPCFARRHRSDTRQNFGEDPQLRGQPVFPSRGYSDRSTRSISAAASVGFCAHAIRARRLLQMVLAQMRELHRAAIRDPNPDRAVPFITAERWRARGVLQPAFTASHPRVIAGPGTRAWYVNVCGWPLAPRQDDRAHRRRGVTETIALDRCHRSGERQDRGGLPSILADRDAISPNPRDSAQFSRCPPLRNRILAKNWRSPSRCLPCLTQFNGKDT